MARQDSGLIVAPDDGIVLTNPIGGRMALKLRDADTAGSYSLHENVLPAGSAGPRPHIHRQHEEVFYVLVGTLSIRIGPAALAAPAGSCVVVPRGVVHQPSNPGPQPVRVLLIFSPGGMERFFLDAAEWRVPIQRVSSEPAALEAAARFAEKYHFEFADLPELRS
jgi:mannose-6-phosphate isomerase-like protein (cupin superfamily)